MEKRQVLRKNIEVGHGLGLGLKQNLIGGIIS